MADSKFLRHVPCPQCDSKDNASLYEDGSIKCHACDYKDTSGMADGPPAEEPEVPMARPGNLLEVDYRDLRSRGIFEDTCRKLDYGIAELHGEPVQVATFYTKGGQPVAQKIRTASKEFRILGDISAATLYGQQAYPAGGKNLIITEGEIDALSAAQAQGLKWPVVSVPNGASSAARAVAANLEFVESFDRVVLMFDMDEPGQKAALEVAEILTPGKAAIATLPLKDPNELVKAGRTREIVDAMWQAKTYRPDGIVEGDELWDLLKNQEEKPSIEFPFPDVQARTRGMRYGEVIVVGAGTSVGKTTLVRELEYHAAMQGEKVGVVHLEEPIKDSAEGLLGIHTDKPLHLNPKALSAIEYRAAYEEIMDRFSFYDHWGSLDPAVILGKIRYLIRGCGCRVVFLDHLSIVVSGDMHPDERKVIDKIMTDLTSLAQETGAIIVVVSHLSKPEGKGFEEGRAVALRDFRGSASIGQLGFTLLGLERDLQKEDGKARLRVLKCRYTGKTGKADLLHYNEETGRLKATPDDEFNDDF